jgi:hypothetical protein
VGADRTFLPWTSLLPYFTKATDIIEYLSIDSLIVQSIHKVGKLLIVYAGNSVKSKGRWLGRPSFATLTYHFSSPFVECSSSYLGLTDRVVQSLVGSLRI